MLKPYSIQRFVLIAVAAALALSFAAPAFADTIYLKNGRQITSSQVRVEGDRVLFIQYGGEVALPMSLVDRIVLDARVEPEAAPPPPPPAADSAADSADPADPEGTVAPIDTEAFWQDRIRALQTEKAQVELRIEDLRRTERAFLFSKRSTAETRQSLDDAQERLAELDQEMTELHTEARRAGIPPGWLRLPPGEGGRGGTSGG